MPRIFVSHSSDDNTDAKKFVDWLLGHGFEELFLDFHPDKGILPGEGWEKRLYEEIERATVVVVLLSQQWLKSTWCFAEFAQARGQGKVVLPVVILPGGEKFPAKDLQLIDLVKDRKEGLERLLRRLRELALEGPASFRLPAGRAPYPGLMSFEKEDAAVFFGREVEVRQTVERLEQLRVRGGARVLLVHGESGSGKSSLLKAGLLPQIGLRGEDWIVLPGFRPGTYPREELRAVLLSELGGGAAEAVSDLLEKPSEEAAGAVVKALREHTGKFRATVLVAIDQFEEWISLPAAEEQERFLKVLEALLDERHKTLAVATLRTSDLPQVAARLELSREEYLVGPFPLKSLPQIVRRPAAVAGIRVDEELVNAITRDAASSDTLPLVAFMLRRLYDLHGADHHLSLAEYESMGDLKSGLRPLETCIRDAADEALKRSQASEAELAALRELFVSGLVRLNDGNSYVRRTLPLAELPQEARRLCDALEKERLLIRREDGCVEVAHEALFRVWPLLVGWLEEEREFLQGLGTIDRLREAWQKEDAAKRDEAVLGGLMLSRAEQWLERHPGRFQADARKFIEASTRARIGKEANKRKALRAVSIFGVASGIAIIVVAGVAIYNMGQARSQATEAGKQKGIAQSEAAEAKRQAEIVRRGSYGASIRAAAMKFEQGDLYGTLRILDEIKTDKPAWEWNHLRSQCDTCRVCLKGHKDHVNSLAFNRLGNALVTASEDHTARLWRDLPYGEPVVLEGHEGPVKTAKFDKAAERIVTASDDGTVRVWKVQGDPMPVILKGHSGGVVSAEFSPDGTRILSAGTDGCARIWNPEDGSSIELKGHQSELKSAAFNADGSMILTVSRDAVVVWDGRSGARLKDFGDAVFHCAKFSRDGNRVAVGQTSKEMLFGVHMNWQAEVVVFDASQGWKELGKTGSIWEDAALEIDAGEKGEWAITFEDRVNWWDERNPTQQGMSIRKAEGVLAGSVINPAGTSVLLRTKKGSPEDYTSDMKLCGILHGHATDQAVSAAVFHPTGYAIATASADGSVRLWDTPRQHLGPGVNETRLLDTGLVDFQARHLTATGSEIRVGTGEGNKPHLFRQISGGTEVECGVYNSDCTLAATARGGAVTLWSAAAGSKQDTELATLGEKLGPIRSMAFRPDGEALAVCCGDGLVRFWNPKTRQELPALRDPESGILRVAFSVDGQWMMTTSASAARVWDAATGREVHCVRDAEADMATANFSPDGKLVFMVRRDGWGHIREVAGGRLRATLQSYESALRSGSFSPDGERLVTTRSLSPTATVWDTQTGHVLVHLPWQRLELSSASFSADGEAVIIRAGSDVRLWYATPFAERARRIDEMQQGR